MISHGWLSGVEACTSKRQCGSALVLLSLLALAACSPTGSLSPLPGSDAGGSSEAIGLATSEWVAVNLASGAITPVANPTALQAQPAANGAVLLFRRVPAVTALIGSQSGGFGTQDDETPQRSLPVGEFFLATTELTQAQWLALAGSSPWLESDMITAGGAAIGDGLPAYGLSADLVIAATAAYRQARGVSLRLPDPREWERACRAGSSDDFAWGDSRDPAVVGLHAVVAETRGAGRGPQPVGDLADNPLGFHDMHGNVWELVTGDEVRGGSWFDSLPAARSANRQSLPAEVAHPLVGVRLVLEP